MYDPTELAVDPILANFSVGPKYMPGTTTPLKKLSPGMGLYQVLNWAARAPDKSKPWAVVNLQTGDVNGRWHATREDALAQARAMYSTMGDKAKVHSEEEVHNAFFLFADATLVSDDGVKWIEAIAPKTYVTPAYGEVVVTPEKIDNFVRNINTNTRGQDIAINFEHGIDPAKGLKAAGWIRSARKNDRGNLELGLDFTEPAKQEISNGEWKYFSLEWDDEWMHPDGLFFQDVVMGGALTNRPVAKGLMPINFSEIFTEKEQLDAAIQSGSHLRSDDDKPEYEFAVWTTAYVNSLPDSSFLWIGPDGTRHLPYKDKSGVIDLPHLRNAAARLNQVKGMPSDVMTRISGRIKSLLGSKNASEMETYDSEWHLSEEKEWEHSAPGTVAPRLVDSGIDDLAIVSGSRRQTPPFDDPPQVGALYDDVTNGEVTIRYSEAEAVGYLTSAITGLRRIHTNDGDAFIERIERILALDSKVRSFNELQSLTNEVRTYLRSNGANSSSTSVASKGGYTVGELTDRDLRELRTILDVDDDAKIVEGVKVKFGELAALRDAVSASEQERIFAETYPQFYAQHQDLVRRDRTNAAKSFSESVQKLRKPEGFGLKTTNQGLTTSALEKIEAMHVKFSEGTASVEDFEEVVKGIMHGGIVQFGELGTSKEDDSIPEIDGNSATGVANARKLFGEVVAKIRRENPDMDLLAATNEAAKRHPDLADLYKVTLPA